MKKQFVTYEIAAAMEELGFKDECLGYYDRQSGELFFNDLDRGVIVPLEILLPAPLWQQATDWFEQTHKIYLTEIPIYINLAIGDCKLDSWTNNLEKNKEYLTRYEARAAAITKAIEIVKEKMKNGNSSETNERPPMDTTISTAKCPECGAPEIDAMTPRTVYECGSSDYDQRPGTFAQSERCMKKQRRN